MTAILSLDGGGLRGLITALILQRLEQARPGFLDHFDLITGTSTGALLALALARGMTPSEIARIYETRASEIFRDSLLDNVRDLGKSVGAQYQNKGLIRVLGDVFGEGTLGDLRKRVAICAFDLDNELPDPKQRSWAPKDFSQLSGTGFGCRNVTGESRALLRIRPNLLSERGRVYRRRCICEQPLDGRALSGARLKKPKRGASPP